MKRLLIWGLIAFAGYKGYRHYSHPAPANGGASSQVELFVGPDCGRSCTEVEGLLQERGVAYATTDISTPEGSRRGVNDYPTTRVGGRSIVGNRLDDIVGALAETFGNQVLTPREQRAMAGHFDDQGRPLVVLYGTSWCGYCKAQREFFAKRGVPFRDIDVEVSSSGRAAYDALSGSGYPLVYVGYRRFAGYGTDEIANAWQEIR